ncbi:MAG: ABC transporter substrate-binding protein [Burkholderiales bacterium]|nr:ABC transporter substrate-binding protein [Burkholderiales bacterium]
MRSLMAWLLLLFAPVALAQSQNRAPDQLVMKITTEVIGVVKEDKAIQSGDMRRIVRLVEERVLPHFNFTRMTQIAVAVNWRRATPEQQKQLVEQFRTLLVRTYSSALALYRDQEVAIKPLRARPGDTDVTVRSEIRQRGSQPLGLDYEMEKTDAGWKVYDIKVGGVSLVSTYRDEFTSQVREVGIDGLIKVLAAKNRQLEAKSKT